MQALNGKVNGSTITANEWNQMPSELQNIITALGQTLSSGDLNQVGKGVGGYVAASNHYAVAGAANALTLTSTNGLQALPVLNDGTEVRFRANANNTAATTLDVDSLGGLGLINADGSARVGGELEAGRNYTAEFNSSLNAFVLTVRPTTGLVASVSGGTNINIGGTGVDPIVNLDAAISLTSVVATAVGGGSTSALRAVSTGPGLELRKTDGTLDNKSWDIRAATGQLLFRAFDDANSTNNSFMEVDRTGIVIDSVTFPGTAVGIGSTDLDSKLHISDGSAGAVTAVANTVLTIENSGDAFLSILAPDANEKAIVFGEPASNVAGGIHYNTSAIPDGFEFIVANGFSFLSLSAAGNLGLSNVGTALAATTRFHIQVGGNDNVQFIRLENVGTNGGDTSFRAGDRDPNGVITGNAGQLYVRVDGVNSNMYINRDAVSGTTWTAMI